MSQTPPPASVSTPGASPSQPTHPIIWGAALILMAVVSIGDGLLAVRSLLASVTASRNVTPS